MNIASSRFSRILCAALLAASLGACGDEPEPTPPADTQPEARAKLVVESLPADATGIADHLLDIGSILVGEGRTATVVVRNAGDVAATLRRTALAAPFSSRAPEEVELAPGDEAEIDVLFVPMGPGTFETLLALDAGDERLTVRLAGKATVTQVRSCGLSVDARPVHWPLVGAGYEVAETVLLTNLGNAPCIVEPGIEGDDFSLEDGAIEVGPGSTAELSVSWRPLAPGPAAGALRLLVGDAEWTVALTGTAVAGCLTTEETSIDFGAVDPGCGTSEREMSVTNACAHPVTIQLIEVETEDEGESEEFGIFSRPELPALLEPGATQTIELTYVGLDIGADEETLVVREANGAEVRTSLLGSGELQTRITDRFEQDGVSGTTSRFFLTDHPADADGDGAVENDIEVLVDGVAVEPATAGGTWAYNAEVNAIDFDPEHVPASGAELEVTYAVVCVAP